MLRQNLRRPKAAFDNPKWKKNKTIGIITHMQLADADDIDIIGRTMRMLLRNFQKIGKDSTQGVWR